MSADDPPQPQPVEAALAAVSAAPLGLLGLTMPLCGACVLLPASLAEVRRARPGLAVAVGEFATVADWGRREDLLWPRGIHVSRSSVPALALLRDGEVVASRAGGGPAEAIERWLEPILGPPENPLPPDGPTDRELAALDAIAATVAHQRSVKHHTAGA